MYIKVHKSYKPVVALCDSDLLGKKFEEGMKQLDVRENFYKGNEVSKEEAIKVLHQQAHEDATYNIVGKEATETAIQAGITNQENIGKIAGIPLIIII